MTLVIEGWTIKHDGPGYWASDPDDVASVWITDDGCLHYEALGGDECNIPLAVIDRLRSLDSKRRESGEGGE